MTNNFFIDNFKHLTTTPENAEQLKKLVLQMAVQGKLTAQWRADVQTRYSASPEILQSPDYNARALLDKIKTEKEQLNLISQIRYNQSSRLCTTAEKYYCHYYRFLINTDNENNELFRAMNIALIIGGLSLILTFHYLFVIWTKRIDWFYFVCQDFVFGLVLMIFYAVGHQKK
ncbi:MAG: hypothetical protein ACOC10_09235 [Bacteroidota bacterium]